MGEFLFAHFFCPDTIFLMTHETTIIAASYLYNPGRPPIAGGAVAIRNGRIAAVGSLAQLRTDFVATVEEFPGCVLFPGMVNAHTHLELTHFPAWKVRKSLDYAPRTYVDWVIQVIKLRRGLSREEVEHSIAEGARISLEAGTTTLGEILTDFSILPRYQELMLCGRVFLEAIGQAPEFCLDRSFALQQALDTFDDGLLCPGVSPHAPHTLSEQFMREIVQLAAGRDLPLMIHLAESPEEVDFCFDTTGRIADTLYPFAGWEPYLPSPRHMSPVALLDSLGVLTPRTTVVHAVHVTPADISCLRERGVAIVLCPRSNDRLAVGKAPLMLLKGSGIPLALGTDSLASNDSLSVWDELRFLYERFPRLFSPEELLTIATLGGARALHLQEQAGSLERGKMANLQIIRIPPMTTDNHLPNALVEHGELVAVWLAGDPVRAL